MASTAATFPHSFLFLSSPLLEKQETGERGEEKDRRETGERQGRDRRETPTAVKLWKVCS